MSHLLKDYADRLRHFSPNARLFLLSVLVLGFASSIVYLLLNIYLLSLGYKQDFIGLIAALPPLITALLAVPAGIVGNHIGHKQALIWGTLLIACGTLGVVAFPFPGALVTASGLAGLGGALLQVVTAPFMIAESQARERTHLFSVQFAISTIAGFFGSLVGGALPPLFARLWAYAPESTTVYQITLAGAATLAFVGTFPLLRMYSSSCREGAHAPLSWRLKTPLRLVFKLTLPNLILGLGAGLFIPFMNVFLKLQFNAPDALLGTLFAFGAVGMGLASLAGPPLAQRIGKVRTMVWTQVLSIPFLVIMAFVPILWVAAVAFVVRYTLMPMSAPIYSLFVMEQVAPEDRATVNGWSTMAWNLCFAGSAWLSGQVQMSWGFAPLFVIVCIVYISSILLQYLLFAPLERHERLGEAVPLKPEQW